MAKTLKFILIILFCCPNPALAQDCPKPVQLIQKDEKANCKGFLFSPDKEQEVAKKVDQLTLEKDINDLLTKKTKLLETEVDVLNDRVQLYTSQSETLAKALEEQRNKTELEKYLYFGLGIVVTGLAVYGASKLK